MKKEIILVLTISLFSVAQLFAQSTPNVIPTQGNVGFGVTSPNAKLQVNGRVIVDSTLTVSDSMTVQSNLRVDGDQSVGGDQRIDGDLHLTGNLYVSSALANPDSCAAVVGLNPQGQMVAVGLDDCSSGTQMPFWRITGNYLLSNNYFAGSKNNFDYNIKTNNQWRMTITGDGKVGIGTRTPVSAFELRTSDTLDALFYSTSTSTSRIWAVNSLYAIGMGVDQNGTGFIYENINAPTALISFKNGSIGMGTSTPTPGYKLSVNGFIRAKKVVVESGWADYVFEPGYKLMSLPELKRFVEEKRHLPGVPTAAEVAENGIELGMATTMLLEKIEELTLYVIQLEEKQRKLEELMRSR